MAKIIFMYVAILLLGVSNGISIAIRFPFYAQYVDYACLFIGVILMFCTTILLFLKK